MLEAARNRYRNEYDAGRLALHETTMLELPWPDDSLDALITVNTIYFVEDLVAVFAEMSRVLKPGGRAVVGIGDPEAMAAMPFTRHGFRIRPVAEVSRGMEAAGLGRVRHERVGEGSGAAHVLVGIRGPAR
jgi:SAM-dependent methyltransferase